MTTRHRIVLPLNALLRALFGMALACVLVSACAARGIQAPAASPKEQAAAEATAIIQSAEATALVLQAHAQATALVHAAGQVDTPQPTDLARPTQPGVRAAAVASTPPPTVAAAAIPLPVTKGEQGQQPTRSASVELLRVEIGTESGLIAVQFKATPSLTRRWQQGVVYVIDEATGKIYNEVPVVPIIGPLLSRPKVDGQLGYVMLVNAPPPGVKPGSVVTVVLGDFRQEHVVVR